MPSKKNKQRKAVETLLGSPKNVNSADSDGWTPLMTACHRRPLKDAQALIDAGADVDKGDAESFRPLMCAAVEGRTEIIGRKEDHRRP